MEDLASDAYLESRGTTNTNYDPFWDNDYYPFRTIVEIHKQKSDSTTELEKV
jgi:hypothetical protein